MKVIIAENSGVCFGVKRALNLLEESAQKGENEKTTVVMLGPLIHNPRVVKEYSSKGVEVCTISTVPQNSIVVIRSHGITSFDEESLHNIDNLEVVDTTCPYVLRIHRLVEKMSSSGYVLIVLGDKDHSEVQGITSRIKGEFLVIHPNEILTEWDEIEKFIEKNKLVFAVAQTTSRPSNYENLIKKIRKFTAGKSYIRFDNAQTICNATFKRQDSARELATRVDAMIVLGGMNSSNTQKLFQVVYEKNKNSFRVESISDFSPSDLEKLKKCKITGLTAGASTPDDQIEEMKMFLESLK